jgi:hypothetical protein
VLKLINTSRQKKTGDIPQTYRSGGEANQFGTCPSTCPLKCKSAAGANVVDEDYARALANAVPRQGKAYSYSHFHWLTWKYLGFNLPGKTVMNYSAKTPKSAALAVRNGVPAVWAEEKPQARTVDGVKFAPCPADVNSDISCVTCGNGDPLCARPDRKFVVVFKQKVWKKTPCYAANGHTVFSWRNAGKQVSNMTDGEKVLDWVKDLPRRSLLRHHIAGDIGKVID